MDPLSNQTPLGAPLASGSAAGPAPGTPANAATLAVKHGGNQGGRPRKDGLAPGSPEAVLKDRNKDIERKRNARAQARQVLAVSQAATIPPADPAAPGAGPAPALGAPPVPWDPSTLRPIFEQILPAVERWSTERLLAKAVKAGAPVEQIKEVRTDAAWPAPAKAAINATGPDCLAKLLNSSGIGAQNAPELILATAVTSILVAQFSLHATLDRMIQEKQPPADAATAKSP